MQIPFQSVTKSKKKVILLKTHFIHFKKILCQSPPQMKYTNKSTMVGPGTRRAKVKSLSVLKHASKCPLIKRGPKDVKLHRCSWFFEHLNFFLWCWGVYWLLMSFERSKPLILPLRCFALWRSEFSYFLYILRLNFNHSFPLRIKTFWKDGFV